jgi:hypothetical protein
MKKIKIELMYDGWSIYDLGTGKHYHWYHQDEDMGTAPISRFLADRGFDVEVEEVA